MFSTRTIFVLPVFLTAHLILAAQATGKTHTATANKQNSKITLSTFEGTWRGEEKCQNISAPVATITVTPKNQSEVIITGMYSTTGEVIGIIKGNTITIPRQQIPDPIFMQMRIEGNLTLLKDRQLLSGILIISNHDARDNCGVTYKRVISTRAGSKAP